MTLLIPTNLLQLHTTCFFIGHIRRHTGAEHYQFALVETLTRTLYCHQYHGFFLIIIICYIYMIYPKFRMFMCDVMRVVWCDVCTAATEIISLEEWVGSEKSPESVTVAIWWKIRCHAICVTSDHGANIYFYGWSLPKRFSVNFEVSWWLFNSTINLEQKLLHNT